MVLDYRRKNAAAGHRRRSRWASTPTRDQGFLGIGVLDAPWAPFTIDFNLANVGGPSAGLMFSLAVIDKLTTGDLNGGKFVAGTGTITGDGKVGPIGGITHKIAGRPRGRGATVLPGPRRQLRGGQDGPRGRPRTGQGARTSGRRWTRCKTLSAGGERPTLLSGAASKTDA